IRYICHHFFLLFLCVGTLTSQVLPPVMNRPAAAPSPLTPNVSIRAPREGAPGPRDVRVEAVTQESEGSIYHGRGSVRLETAEALLKADEVDYNEETGDAEARGNVYFKHFHGNEEIYAEKVEYNVSTETGKFYEVHGSSPAKIDARPG